MYILCTSLFCIFCFKGHFPNVCQYSSFLHFQCIFFTVMDELDPEELFLRDARNGNLEGIQRLLMSKIKEEAKIDINCKGWTRHSSCFSCISKISPYNVFLLPNCQPSISCKCLYRVVSGKSKSNHGWTPLHLACYFGHKDVAEVLLKVQRRSL